MKGFTMFLQRGRAPFFRLSTLVVLGLATTLSSCAKYKPKPLTPISQTAKKGSKSSPVSVAARELLGGDTQHYFDKDFQRAGLRTVQLTIANESDRACVLHGTDIELNLESPALVARKVHFNTPLRVLAWVVPSLFAWPCLAGAAYEGLYASQANKRIDEDLGSRAIDNQSTVVVPPGSTINRVMFVKAENLTRDFQLSLSQKFAPEPLHFSLLV